MANHRVDWKGPQPTVDEALEFADLGLPAMEYSNSYGRALRALAVEVRHLQGTAEPTGECICPTCGIRHGSSNMDGGF